MIPRLVLLAAIAGLAGCTTVREAPANPSSQPGVITGIEPQPAPIPQKNVAPGESSLRKKGPDQPLVPAN